MNIIWKDENFNYKSKQVSEKAKSFVELGQRLFSYFYKNSELLYSS